MSRKTLPKAVRANSPQLDEIMSRGISVTRPEDFKPVQQTQSEPPPNVKNAARMESEVNFIIKIPGEVKQAIKQRALDQGVTLRALTLMAYRSFGIQGITDNMLEDQRGGPRR